MNALARIALMIAIACCAPLVALAADELRPVADLKHEGPVDFNREVMPIFKRSCLACHNAAKAEGGLVLESVAATLKGGDGGAAVVAGKPDESTLFLRARGGGDGLMPPEDNNAAAAPLKPEELALVKLWIAQGATASQAAAESEKIDWQPLPPGVQSIYAAALTGDGQYVACARANQIFLYHVPTNRLLTRLTDPELLKSGVYSRPGIADLDLIQSLAFNADGTLLASGGYRNIKLWQRPRDVRRQTVEKLGDVRSMSASADGKLWAGTLADGNVIVVDSATGKIQKTLAAKAQPTCAPQFTADAQFVLSAGADKSVTAWKLADGSAASRHPLPAEPRATLVANNGVELIVGAADKTLYVYKTDALSKAPGEKPLEPAAKLAGHPDAIVALAAWPGAPAQFLAASADGTVAQWDLAGGKQIKKIAHGTALVTAAVRPDGQQIASAGADGVVKLWNVADGKQAGELRGEYAANRRVAELERAGNRAKAIVAAEKAAQAETEKAATAEAELVKKTAEAAVAAKKPVEEKTAAAKKAADERAAAQKALDDAKAALAQAEAGKAGSTAALTEAETAAKAAAAKLAEAKAAATKAGAAELVASATVAEQALADSLAKLAAARAGADKSVAAGAEKVKQAEAALTAKVKPAEDAEKARVDAENSAKGADRASVAAQNASKKAQQNVEAAKARVVAAEKVAAEADKLLAESRTASAAARKLRAIAYSPDNVRLAAALEDGTISIWNAVQPAALDTLHGHKGAVNTLRFLDATALSTTGADGALIVWETLPGWTWQRTIVSAEKQPIGDRVTALDFSPDGKWLAAGGGEPSRAGELAVWNVADGALVRSWPQAHSDTVFGVRFSPDGAYLASCGADKFVKVHQAADGKFVRAFEGHTHHVMGVAWTLDGRVLASAGADNVVKVWDYLTGDQRRTIQGLGKEVTSISLLPDNVTALVTSGDATVRLYRTTDGGQVRAFAGAADFVYSGAASADGKLIAAGGQDGVLRLWNAENGQAVRTFDPPAPEPAAAQVSR